MLFDGDGDGGDISSTLPGVALVAEGPEERRWEE